MKKFTKILALILAAVTLLSVMTIPTFAAYNYLYGLLQKRKRQADCKPVNLYGKRSGIQRA